MSFHFLNQTHWTQGAPTPPHRFNDGVQVGFTTTTPSSVVGLKFDAYGGVGGREQLYEITLNLTGINEISVWTRKDTHNARHLRIYIGNNMVYGAGTVHPWTKRVFNVSNYSGYHTIKLGVQSSSGASYTQWVAGFSELKAEGVINSPPTSPPEFTKQITSNSVNLSSEEVTLQWSTSDDPEGDEIKYILEFYNGSSWMTVASNLIDTTYNYVLPKANTDKAQFRVKAVDAKGAESPYRMSNVFQVYEKLILIEDKGRFKTYENNAWKTI